MSRRRVVLSLIAVVVLSALAGLLIAALTALGTGLSGSTPGDVAAAIESIRPD